MAESQRKYGILEKILSLGDKPESWAIQQVNTWIREHQEPKNSQRWGDAGNSAQRWGDAGNSAISIILRCAGFVHRLSTSVYIQTLNHGQQNLSDQIKDILDAEPNRLFSSSNAEITENYTGG